MSEERVIRPADSANPNEWITIEDLQNLFVNNFEREERYRRYYGSFPAPSKGELLYVRWCGSSRRDRARYYRSMNSADQKAWEDLADDIFECDPEFFENVIRNI